MRAAVVSDHSGRYRNDRQTGEIPMRDTRITGHRRTGIQATALVASYCLAFFTIYASGCDNGTSTLAMEIDATYHSLSSTICQKVFECCSREELDEMYKDTDVSMMDSEDTCTEKLGVWFGAVAKKAIERVQEGSTSWDTELATACTTKIETMSCSDYSFNILLPDKDCGQFEPGLGEIGDSCWATIACKPSLFCHSGTCEAYRKENEACTTKDGLYDDWIHCGEDLFCEMKGELAGTCVKKRMEGEACDYQTPCGAGLLCKENRCFQIVRKICLAK
jgi:hypothetical protein